MRIYLTLFFSFSYFFLLAQDSLTFEELETSLEQRFLGEKVPRQTNKAVYAFTHACHSPNNTGVAFALHGHYDIALDHFNSALKIETAPKEKTLFNKALSLTLKGYYKVAIEILLAIEHSNPTTVDDYYSILGYSYYQLGHITGNGQGIPYFRSAKDCFQKCDLESPIIFYNLILCDIALGKRPSIDAELIKGSSPYLNSFIKALPLHSTSEFSKNSNLPYDSQWQRGHYPSEVNYGYYCIQSQKYDLAIQKLSKFCKKVPGHQEAYLALAKAYFLKGDYSNSAKVYQKILNINSKSSKAYCGLSFISLAQENLSKAKIYATKALKFNPENTLAHLSLGKTFYKKALNNKTKDKNFPSQTSDLIHNSYYHINKFMLTKTSADSINIQEGEMILAYLNLYPYVGSINTAFHYFEKISKYEKYKMEGLLGMGLCYLKLGEFQEGYSLFNQVIKFGNIQQKAVANQSLADLLFHAGEYESAKQFYLDALKITHDTLSVSVGLGNCFLKLEQNENAEKMYQIAKQEEKNNLLILNNLAVAWFQNSYKGVSDTLNITLKEKCIKDLENSLNLVLNNEQLLYSLVIRSNLSTFYALGRSKIDAANDKIASLDTFLHTPFSWAIPILKQRNLNNLGIANALNVKNYNKADSCFNLSKIINTKWLVPQHNQNILRGMKSKFSFLDSGKAYEDYIIIFTFLTTPVKENPVFQTIVPSTNYMLDYPCIPTIHYIETACENN